MGSVGFNDHKKLEAAIELAKSFKRGQSVEKSSRRKPTDHGKAWDASRFLRSETSPAPIPPSQRRDADDALIKGWNIDGMSAAKSQLARSAMDFLGRVDQRREAGQTLCLPVEENDNGELENAPSLTIAEPIHQNLVDFVQKGRTDAHIIEQPLQAAQTPRLPTQKSGTRNVENMPGRAIAKTLQIDLVDFAQKGRTNHVDADTDTVDQSLQAISTINLPAEKKDHIQEETDAKNAHELSEMLDLLSFEETKPEPEDASSGSILEIFQALLAEHNKDSQELVMGECSCAKLSTGSKGLDATAPAFVPSPSPKIEELPFPGHFGTLRDGDSRGNWPIQKQPTPLEQVVPVTYTVWLPVAPMVQNNLTTNSDERCPKVEPIRGLSTSQWATAPEV